MALPRKKARKIVVGGQWYVWIASGNDGWIDLIICSSDVQGQKLKGKFAYHSTCPPRGIDVKSTQQLTITPGIVEQVISYGLVQGWSPSEVKADLDLHHLNDKIRLTA